MEITNNPTIASSQSLRQSRLKLAFRKIKGMFLSLSYRVRLRIAYECSFLNAIADLPINSSMTMGIRLLRLILRLPGITRVLSIFASRALRHACNLSTSQTCGITENSMSSALSMQRELEKLSSAGASFIENVPDSLKP